VQRSNAQANTILRGLREGADPQQLAEMYDQAKAVKHFMHGHITIESNNVVYKGEPVHNVVADRILQFMRDGLPYMSLVNFLEKLMANPSNRSVEQLYTFLEHESLPITPDGTFLAYKAVTRDWKDKYSRSINNHVGSLVRMDRNKVSDDPASSCSRGLHVGAIGYVQSFASGYDCGGDRIIIVEVNPANVVSVPHDSSSEKVRCCEYRVVDEFQDRLPNTYVSNADHPYDEDEQGALSDDWYVQASEGDRADAHAEGYDEGYTAGIEAARARAVDAVNRTIDDD
jgi:hypothetical protein